jgi:MurNAc alpha-1-phosphate uridylyltransferase
MPGKIHKAMVLAAGYGLRLRPLTEHLPKPLVPVAGRPMIAYALDRLREYGLGEVVINVSHLKEPLVEYLTGCEGMKFQISEEAEPLETGGGIKKALPLLGHQPFFTINSDIIWQDGHEGALARLARQWDGDKMDILLLAQPRARAVGYDRGEDHLFITPGNTIGYCEADAPYIIAGVGIVHPRIFAGAPKGKFSMKVLWLRAMAQHRLFCLPHQGRWFQTGTVPDIAKAEEILAQNSQ